MKTTEWRRALAAKTGVAWVPCRWCAAKVEWRVIYAHIAFLGEAEQLVCEAHIGVVRRGGNDSWTATVSRRQGKRTGS